VIAGTRISTLQLRHVIRNRRTEWDLVIQEDEDTGQSFKLVLDPENFGRLLAGQKIPIFTVMKAPHD